MDLRLVFLFGFSIACFGGVVKFFSRSSGRRSVVGDGDWKIGKVEDRKRRFSFMLSECTSHLGEYAANRGFLGFLGFLEPIYPKEVSPVGAESV